MQNEPIANCDRFVLHVTKMQEWNLFVFKLLYGF
jgi:hypothetical protein